MPELEFVTRWAILLSAEPSVLRKRPGDRLRRSVVRWAWGRAGVRAGLSEEPFGLGPTADSRKSQAIP